MQDWQTCLSRLEPFAVASSERRWLRFNPETLGSLVIDKLYRMLNHVDFRSVQRSSRAAASLYVWAMSVLDEHCDVDFADDRDDVRRQESVESRGSSRDSYDSEQNADSDEYY